MRLIEPSAAANYGYLSHQPPPHLGGRLGHLASYNLSFIEIFA
jgi:hypothetical protein